MTPHPQPKEYIITMARIIKARNMLMADGYHNADVLDRMVNLLRSHPHTPAAPEIKVACCAACPCRTPTCDIECKEWLSQQDHDATIRNQTLDNILKFVCTYEGFIGLDNIDGFEIYGVKSVNLKEHIESLRQSTEAPK